MAPLESRRVLLDSPRSFCAGVEHETTAETVHFGLPPQ